MQMLCAFPLILFKPFSHSSVLRSVCFLWFLVISFLSGSSRSMKSLVTTQIAFWG